ncbi:tyrosine--tRNA ligase [Haloarculaceae archaeon H-GB2-1]|nr:tyrosine--tRNA ligase [Haloarculaceae archaeon H-GB1-1]MEA5409585.1 tyrosine--tRNA ligase [Haloarculaceae archaeon H-GB2-1]
MSTPTPTPSDPGDPTDRFALITRNAAEVVTEDEIWDIAFEPAGKRAYVGYEPSGELHIGHLVTVNKLIDLQKAGMDIVILLADIHARLNEKGTPEEIQETADTMRRQFLAAGLDPSNTEFVYGSDFQLDEEYVMDTHELAMEANLNRARKAVADGIAGREDNLRLSHANYAVMQAVDIPHLDVDLAVGGMAQRRVHMLARDQLPQLGYESPPCLHTPLVMGLDGEPMSSSKGNVISMGDETAVIEDKIADAYCPGGELAENPIVDIYKYHLFPRFEDITVSRPTKYGGDVTYSSFKKFADTFASGDLHPQDAKETAAAYLDRLLADGRQEVH